MSIMRLTIRLKCVRKALCELNPATIFVVERKNEVGFVEALRSFGTSNGYWLREPRASPMQEEIVNALRVGQRTRASHLLSELSSRDRALKVEDLIPIFKYCARTPDPLFAMETWQFMMEKDIKLSGGCYSYTIRALCKGGYLKEAFNILSIQRENSDICLTLPVYNNLLEACVGMNSLNHASECLHLMEQVGVGKNAVTYTLLLKLAVLQQDLSAVHEIWKESINYHCLNIITLRELIWAFTRLGDLESAYVALQQMIAGALQRKFSITESSEGRFVESRLDFPIPFHDDLARNMYIKGSCSAVLSSSDHHKENDSNEGVEFGMDVKEVRADGLSLSEQPLSGPVVKVLTGSFDDIIRTCASLRNLRLAEQLMLEMQNLDLKPSRGAYDGFIRALVYEKGFRDGMEVLKVMQQTYSKPYNSTLAAMSVSCSRDLQLDLAETFMAQISKYCHIYPFNEFLEACDTLDQPERAVRMLAKMKYLKLMPDIWTYELLFSLFGNVNAPYEDGNILSQGDVAKRIHIIEMDMMRHGIQHSHISMQNLLKALGMEGMTQQLIQYLRIAENQLLYRSTYLRIQIYNTVLHSLVNAKESDMAIEIFKGMISCRLSPNAATYHIMIDCCSIIKCYRSACALISMMIRNGFCPTVITYTALIKILLNSEDFSQALKLLDRTSSEGIQPDVLLYDTILRVASEKGRIDVVELIVEKMHQEKIQPDPSTCSHVFTAYVENGFHSTAMEALQVLSMRMISEQDDILEDNRLKYEHLIFDEELEAESQIIQVFNDSPYLAVALLYLRWCATFLSPISWLPNQSPWAKRLSSNYGSSVIT